MMEFIFFVCTLVRGSKRNNAAVLSIKKSISRKIACLLGFFNLIVMVTCKIRIKNIIIYVHIFDDEIIRLFQNYEDV